MTAASRPPDEPTSARPHGITPRQAEVLELVVARYGNPEIAEVLGISKRTVESHVAELLRKYRVAERAALIRTASSSTAPVRTPVRTTVQPDDPRVRAAEVRAAAAKRRELDAHRRAITTHRLAAELFTRLGRPERARSERARADKERQLFAIARDEAATAARSRGHSVDGV